MTQAVWLPQTVCVDPRHDPLWRQLIWNEQSSLFHSPMWMDSLSQTYGWEFQSVVLIGLDGAPRAGLPFCALGDVLGARIAILPFSDYCDPIAQRGEDWAAMVEMLIAQGTPVSLRCLHSDLPREDPRFMETRKAKWHGLDIRPQAGVLWRDLDGGTR